MPSDADTFHDREHGGVTVLAHRGAFIRHSQALGMNLSMPHAAWTGADQAVETRCGLAGSVRSGKEIITPAEHCAHELKSLPEVTNRPLDFAGAGSWPIESRYLGCR